MTTFEAVGSVVGLVVATLVSLRLPGSAELRYAVLAAVYTVVSFVVPGGRVLTVPFAFVLILILLYWGARVSAEREES